MSAFTARSWVRLLAAALIVLFAANDLHAQNVQLSASVSSTRVAVGRPFTYTVTVQAAGGSVPRPQVSIPPEFQNYGTSTSQNFSFINGAISASISFTYTLAATKEGRFTIPPAVIRLGDQEVRSNAVEIEALPGAAPPAASPAPPSSASSAPAAPSPTSGGGNVDVGISLIPSKTRVYLGEPVTLSTVVYGNTALAGYSLEPQRPEGFWIEDAKLPDQPEVEKETRNGQQYYTVLVKRSILFPTTTGKVKLPAVSGMVQYYVRKQQRDPFADFFDDPFFRDPFFRNPFFNRSVVVTEQTAARSGTPEITVLPLPENGKPADFSGAVGSFRVTTRADRTEAIAGEAVTVRIEITGQGNLKGISAPKLPTIPGVNLYSSNTEAGFSATRTSYTATKIFEYVLVPLSQGEFRVPAVSFPFFDPQAGRYRVVASETLMIRVQPGSAAPAAAPGALQVLTTGMRDIRGLRPLGASTRIGFAATGSIGVHWILLNLLPVLAALTAFLYRRHRHLIETDPAYGGIHLSRGAARKFLKNAARLLPGEDQEAFYFELTQAISRYIGHRFHVPPQAVQPDGLEEVLSGKVDREAIGRIRELLRTAHLARYSPTRIERSRREEDLRAGERLIRELERR